MVRTMLLLRSIVVMLTLAISVSARSQTAAGGQNQTAAPAPSPTTQIQPAPFGTQIRKTVLFVEIQCKDGNKLVTAKGTGFLVGLAAPELGKDQMFDYLVTNRHVAL